MSRFKYYLGIVFKRLRFYFTFKKKGYLGRFTSINNLGTVQVGKNLSLGSYVKINVGASGNLEIGDNVHIGDFCQIEVDHQVIIRDGVTVSDNVFLADVTHTFPVNDCYGIKNNLVVGTVEISEHTWIGRNSVINPGKSIGPYNIVGANSVVTKDMKCSRKLIAGQPAKILSSVAVK